MRRACLFAIFARLAFSDAGVLIPSTGQQPDASVLSLDEMSINIRLDNGHARVRVQQIFGSHKNQPLEGNYIFTLPGDSLVSDFAVWDDVTRIPGVILERKRAEEIYNDIRLQALDPGLLQMGERDADEARRTSLFSARVAPVPAYGSKRIEIEYQGRLPVEQLETFLSIPLKPDAYKPQTAGRLSISIDLSSAHALRNFEFVSKQYPMQISARSDRSLKASFEGRNVALTEDFALKYSLVGTKDALEIEAYRDGSGPGFFEASALFSLPPNAAAMPPRTVVALFDASLSMQWEKLERSFQALEALLRSLRPTDRFNLLVFNDSVASYAPAPALGAPDEIERALAFLRAANLRGGTDLQGALTAALAQPLSNDSYIVLLSDLGATRGIIRSGKLDTWYATKWRAASSPRTYVFAVGDDANQPLAKMLAQHDGVYEWVRSTEPIDFKLKAFLAKIGRQPIEGLQLTATPASNFDLIYPLNRDVFPGSVATWAGQYKGPGQATFSLRQTRATVTLPTQNTDHENLPREWAKARVDALLEKIERDGEDDATIDEIIRLSRQYKFITPYTSFLAAPRALLRPRLIRPGDPILRVKTDESIVSVVAIFPFGLMKKLRYLSEEDTWQTRFLAPEDLTDGVHRVRLLLKDRQGRVFRESKTFVIVSKPPVVQVKLDRSQVRRGDRVMLRVSASETTRTIVARMYGAAPVYLRWNPGLGASSGELAIPATLAAGKYKLTVTAEDFAHNIGSREVDVEVIP